jgi:hypothetical protein
VFWYHLKLLVFSGHMLRFANVSSYCFRCLFHQLQGTLYNYYYVILRNKSVGG